MKILITGGHLTPALAFIDHLLKKHPKVGIEFVGRKFSQQKTGQLAIEAAAMQKRELRFYELSVPKQPGWLPWQLIGFSYQYLTAFFRSLKIIHTSKPTVLLTFGGYLALPMSLAAFLLRVPIITHEQTTTAGRANRLIGRFAKAVAISFESSRTQFPRDKTTLTGTPIRDNLLSKDLPKPTWLKNAPAKPLLYITGGNQGSYLLNTLVEQVLRQLTRDYVVIHACGRATTTANYQDQLCQARLSLPKTHQDRYYVREWIKSEELSWILHHSQLALSRAGANTIQELIHAKLPAILVPLPFAFHNEQQQNAKLMSEAGGAIVVAQKDLTPEKLLSTIKAISKTHKAMRRKLELIDLPTNANAKLYSLIKKSQT